MAELTPQERLQPSLLDRLTDLEPDKQSESRERRVLSLRRLREAVLRDLEWLLNTGHFETVVDLEDFPYVRSSVLNYGIPDLSGMTALSMSAETLEKQVRESIVNFEPRISPTSLKVRVAIAGDKMNRNSMTLEIEGELWAEPAPINLYLKTEVDLETGDVTMTER